MDRLQTWKTLLPGESLILKMVYDPGIPGEAGTYDFWADYFPASMPKADEEALQARGVAFPRSELESAHVKFVKK